RTDSNNAGGSGSANTGGTVAPDVHGCLYKTFTNGKPHTFNGTEGVVGLKRWFEKMEQVFEICKCAEDDKVKFAMCTFEGRALTWWNGNARALRIGESNKKKWEDQQGNNHHQQQNRRQEAAKVYVAASAEGRGYAGNLPLCNRCNAHHQPGPCPPRCGECHKLGHQEGDCRTRIHVARDNSLHNVTCFGCGNHGHYRSDCPKLKNQN
ncbi:putative reverse transcriptase domain-containing protein, partial [Tanacetum coccineum]